MEREHAKPAAAVQPAPPQTEHGRRIRQLVVWLRRRLRSDKDAVVVITGAERQGKSTLAWHLGHAVDPEGFGVPRCGFTAREGMRIAAETPIAGVVWVDEAAEGGFSRDALAATNKDFCRFLITNGARNIAYLICFPKLDFLDRYIKDHRACLWIHVEQRGHAVAHLPRRSKFGVETFWQPMFRFSYPMAHGPQWEEYKARKSAYLERMKMGRAGAEEPADATAQDDDDSLDAVRARLARGGTWQLLASWSPYPRGKPSVPQKRVIEAWGRFRRANGLPATKEAIGVNGAL